VQSRAQEIMTRQHEAPWNRGAPLDDDEEVEVTLVSAWHCEQRWPTGIPFHGPSGTADPTVRNLRRAGTDGPKRPEDEGQGRRTRPARG